MVAVTERQADNGIVKGLCLGFLLGVLGLGWVWTYKANEAAWLRDDVARLKQANVELQRKQDISAKAWEWLAQEPIQLKKDGKSGDVYITVPQFTNPIRFPAVCSPELITSF